MFRIIWKDVRNMLRRPLVFLLLFVGLVVGGFSLLVYYVSSSQELKASRMAAGVDNVVEAPAKTGIFETIWLLDLLQEGTLPEIQYASAISYEYEDYDVVGFYCNTEEQVRAADEGKFLDASMMGLNKAVASADIFGDREAELGERIKIKGQPYEIVGLVSAHGGYMPELYDARRLKVGTEDVAGVELDRT